MDGINKTWLVLKTSLDSNFVLPLQSNMATHLILSFHLILSLLIELAALPIVLLPLICLLLFQSSRKQFMEKAFKISKSMNALVGLGLGVCIFSPWYFSFWVC